MGDVIQFPRKEDFASAYRGKIPDDLLNELLLAYDRVLELKDQYPIAEIKVAPEYEDTVRKLVSDFESYSGQLLGRILELEAELCVQRAST